MKCVTHLLVISTLFGLGCINQEKLSLVSIPVISIGSHENKPLLALSMEQDSKKGAGEIRIFPLPSANSKMGIEKLTTKILGTYPMLSGTSRGPWFLHSTDTIGTTALSKMGKSISLPKKYFHGALTYLDNARPIMALSDNSGRLSFLEISDGDQIKVSHTFAETGIVGPILLATNGKSVAAAWRHGLGYDQPITLFVGTPDGNGKITRHFSHGLPKALFYDGENTRMVSTYATGFGTETIIKSNTQTKNGPYFDQEQSKCFAFAFDKDGKLLVVSAVLDQVALLRENAGGFSKIILEEEITQKGTACQIQCNGQRIHLAWLQKNQQKHAAPREIKYIALAEGQTNQIRTIVIG